MLHDTELVRFSSRRTGGLSCLQLFFLPSKASYLNCAPGNQDGMCFTDPMSKYIRKPVKTKAGRTERKPIHRRSTQCTDILHYLYRICGQLNISVILRHNVVTLSCLHNSPFYVFRDCQVSFTEAQLRKIHHSLAELVKLSRSSRRLVRKMTA